MKVSFPGILSLPCSRLERTEMDTCGKSENKALVEPSHPSATHCDKGPTYHGLLEYGLNLLDIYTHWKEDILLM
jgi:hypothetical protein